MHVLQAFLIFSLCSKSTVFLSSINNLDAGITPGQVQLITALGNKGNTAAKGPVIAAASGLKLSKIRSIQEAGARVIPPVSRMRTLAAEGVGAAAETPVSPGKIEIRGNLTIVYECSSKR